MSFPHPDRRPWIQKKRYLIPLVLLGAALLSLALAIPLGKAQSERARSATGKPTITTVTKTLPQVIETETVTKTTTVTPSTTPSTSSRRSTTPRYTAPTTTGTPSTSGSVFYATCADALADDAAPLYRGDPGYRRALDPDGDGVACDL